MKQGKDFASLLWLLHGYIFLLKLFFYKEYLWFLMVVIFLKWIRTWVEKTTVVFGAFPESPNSAGQGMGGVMPMESRCLMGFSHWFRLIIFHLAPSFLRTRSPPRGSSGSHAPAVHQLCPTNPNPSLCSSWVGLMGQLSLVYRNVNS